MVPSLKMIRACYPGFKPTDADAVIQFDDDWL